MIWFFERRRRNLSHFSALSTRMPGICGVEPPGVSNDDTRGVLLNDHEAGLSKSRPVGAGNTREIATINVPVSPPVHAARKSGVVSVMETTGISCQNSLFGP